MYGEALLVADLPSANSTTDTNTHHFKDTDRTIDNQQNFCLPFLYYFDVLYLSTEKSRIQL